IEILASSALFIRAIRAADTCHWVAYGLTCMVSLYTYPLTALVMVAHFAVVVASPSVRNRTVVLPYFLASAGATLAFLPWLFDLATTVSGVKALGILLSNKPTALGVALIFMRDIKASMLDVGAMTPGTIARLGVTVAGTAILAAVVFC